MLHYLPICQKYSIVYHNLIIAKLHTSVFDKALLRLMQSYLTGRYQRSKINDSYSFRNLKNYVVPRVCGSSLGSIIFSVLGVICSSWSMLQILKVMLIITLFIVLKKNNVTNSILKNPGSQKLLDVTIDRKLHFNFIYVPTSEQLKTGGLK